MFIKNIEVFQVQVGPLKAQEPSPAMARVSFLRQAAKLALAASSKKESHLCF